jgi:ABC-2 type transport system permease protein
MSVVYIMWLRQLKRYVRSKPRIIASLGQPMLFLLALGFGFGPIYERAGQGDYLQFLAPGVIAMTVLFSGIFSGIELIWDRQFGFLKETLVAPVPRFQIMLGRTLGGTTVAVLQGLIVGTLCFVAGFRPVISGSLPFTLVFMAMIGFVFTAMGTSIASVLTDFQAFPMVMNLLVMPMFFLSGALFPLSSVPPALVFIASVDPLAYGVDGLRAALVGIGHWNIFLDFGVLALLSVVFLWVGAYLFSRIQV